MGKFKKFYYKSNILKNFFKKKYILIMNKKKLSVVKKISLKQFKDNRGSLTRVFCFKELNKLDIKFNIKQINQVNIKKKGTVKGMHFQIKPFEEDKIVKLVSGKILDVVVDVRKKSKIF